jgi:hexosaminidase
MDESTGAGRGVVPCGIVPAPAFVEPRPRAFSIGPRAAILAAPGSVPAARVGEHLAQLLRPATGFELPVREPTADDRADGDIALLLTGAGGAGGDEGYELDVTQQAMTLRAETAAGLFRGVQTLRQLLPAAVESSVVQSGPWTVPCGRIIDRPRFAYRGVMLDVARHYFPVRDVKRLIDLSALYKVNHLHLHLTDDQGWRIAIDAWPRLATFGGATEVGGGPGGYYTKDDYREIVAYAAQRHMTVVPEVDLPGHTNAALASYPELNCDGIAPERYTGTDVGFSGLCDQKVTYRFLADVLGELAQLTPGPYLHIGGDEAKTLAPEEYATIVARAQEIVRGLGKTVVGWHEIAAARLAPPAVLQFWGVTPDAPEVLAATERGSRLIMSPGNRTYLDMKYDDASPVGLSWAGHITVEDSYRWDPATYLPGLDPAAVLGVEAPLWTETVETIEQVEFLALPRLAAIAELGWSARTGHDWTDFRERLATHAPRWDARGVHYFRAPHIPWAAA